MKAIELDVRIGFSTDSKFVIEIEFGDKAEKIPLEGLNLFAISMAYRQLEYYIKRTLAPHKIEGRSIASIVNEIELDLGLGAEQLMKEQVEYRRKNK